MFCFCCMFAPEKLNKRNKMKLTVLFFALLFARSLYAQGQLKTPVIIKDAPAYVYVDKTTQKTVIVPFKTFFKEWVTNHFQYPEDCLKDNEQGLVKLVFEIDKQGNLLIKKTEGKSHRLREAAAHMFDYFPQLTPAKDENGKLTSVTFAYPVNFKID